jgi:hypothetical protein
MHTQKRRYRSAEFGVNIATSVSPGTFSEIEGPAKEFGVTKSEVLRRLVLRGLAEYHRDGKLPAHAAVSTCTKLRVPTMNS